MIKLILSLLTLILPVLSFSQSGGFGVYNFLNLPGSAQMASRGGYNISIFDSDLNQAEQNPSLLNPSNSNKIALNYIDYFTGINFGYASYAYDWNKYGTFSAGIRYLNYGKFILADENGSITGEFRASDYALNVSWSKDIYKNIRAGITFKPIFSHLETYNSFGIAFDMGISYVKPEKEFCASLLIKNAGFQIKPYYQGHYEPLPFDMQLGLSKKLAHAPFRISLTAWKLNKWNLLYQTEDNTTSISFANESDTTFGDQVFNFFDNSLRHLILGVDIILLKSFYASIGYNHLRRQELKIVDKGGISGFSWGFGLKLKKFGIHYARSSYHLAGGSNHFSLQLDISRYIKNKSVDIIKKDEF